MKYFPHMIKSVGASGCTYHFQTQLPLPHGPGVYLAQLRVGDFQLQIAGQAAHLDAVGRQPTWQNAPWVIGYAVISEEDERLLWVADLAVQVRAVA